MRRPCADRTNQIRQMRPVVEGLKLFTNPSKRLNAYLGRTSA